MGQQYLQYTTFHQTLELTKSYNIPITLLINHDQMTRTDHNNTMKTFVDRETNYCLLHEKSNYYPSRFNNIYVVG